MFSVVVDVARYAEFVPWCRRSRILQPPRPLAPSAAAAAVAAVAASSASSASSASGSASPTRPIPRVGEAATAPTTEPGQQHHSSNSSNEDNNQQQQQFMLAELAIGFQFVETSYVSRVEFARPHFVRVQVDNADSSGLFDHLHTEWRFVPGAAGTRTCWTEFSTAFRFRSAVHRSLADAFFGDVQRQMLAAFERRCALLYPAAPAPGPPAAAASPPATRGPSVSSTAAAAKLD